jgi:hypothetical protein
MKYLQKMVHAYIHVGFASQFYKEQGPKIKQIRTCWMRKLFKTEMSRDCRGFHFVCFFNNPHLWMSDLKIAMGAYFKWEQSLVEMHLIINF